MKKIDFGKALDKARKNARTDGKKTAPKPVRKKTRKQPRKVKDGKPSHIAVDALAGTGKTFTLVVGVAALFASATFGRSWKTVVKKLGFDPKPTAQQSGVWKALKSGPLPRTITYLAYNRTIVDDFGAEWKCLVDVLKKDNIFFNFRTCHSLGFGACCKAYGLKLENVNQFKTQDLLERELGQDLRVYSEEVDGGSTIVSAVVKLVSQCKLNLVNLWEKDKDGKWEALANLATHFEIDLETEDGFDLRDEVFRLVPVILDQSRKETGTIDFDDQVWLPNVNNLPVAVCDLLLGDEAQDWNKAQQALLTKAGRRIVMVGDVNQAIYGFAGADVESIPRMKTELQASRKLETFPLTQTRRCSKAVVRDCQQLVPEFEAFPENPEGSVEAMSEEDMMKRVAEGDLILCRTTAPLVGYVTKLVKAGIKANINGRNFGEGLISLIDRLKAKTLEDLVFGLDNWLAKETAKVNARKHPSEDALIALTDKRDCVLAFTEGADSVKDVKDNINKLFSNDREGVLASTIHRAKGMESTNVFLCHPELLPHPMAKTPWAIGQERNLDFVARSRAKLNLFRVE